MVRGLYMYHIPKLKAGRGTKSVKGRLMYSGSGIESRKDGEMLKRVDSSRDGK